MRSSFPADASTLYPVSKQFIDILNKNRQKKEADAIFYNTEDEPVREY
jgi:hypothetical protein